MTKEDLDGVLMSAKTLYGTRSSHRWATQPGRIDALNLSHVWPAAREYGIPELQPCSFEPEMLAAWHDPRERAEAAQKGAVHFFLDDYRFERVWAAPGKAIEPHRARRCSTHARLQRMARQGLPYLDSEGHPTDCGDDFDAVGLPERPTPAIAIGARETYAFCFEGLPDRSTLAVSAVGVRDKQARDLFRDGLTELISSLRPELLLVYGCMPFDVEVRVHEYPTFWDNRRSK